MSNHKVVTAWINGRVCKSGNLSTDGERLYSYELMIAERDPYKMDVYDYTSTGEFVSVTTSKHVNLALRVAGKANLIDPAFKRKDV